MKKITPAGGHKRAPKCRCGKRVYSTR